MTSQYNEKFQRVAKRIEKGIIIAIAVCFILLTAGEWLLEYAPVRAVLVETDRLEGVSRVP
ncbi:hypothetical protein ACAF76_012130 [Brevibacillus sp. TJ4]|uniref:hypothetical protein n=1 Tax=Brevibacillus sp. TJ4 TaxID=3234853 RepID=UPI0037CE85B7